MSDNGEQVESVDCPKLFSVIVITFNSADYVLATLKSIEDQDYSNIEVIVSDDCSVDSTVEIVNAWKDNLRAKNICRVEVVKAAANAGTTVNCNRGYKKSTGEYIKFIAGDDVLESDCLSVNARCFDIVKADVVFARVNYINEGNLDVSAYEDMQKKTQWFGGLTVKEQYKELVNNGCCLLGCAYSIKRKILQQFGGFDTSMVLVEDYPLFIRVTRAGYKIHVIEERLVGYRLHATSVSANARSGLRALNPVFTNDIIKIYEIYRRREIYSPLIKFDVVLDFFIKKTVIRFGNSKKMYAVLRVFKILSPIRASLAINSIARKVVSRFDKYVASKKSN